MITIKGTAVYPRLNEADTKYKDEGEFHTKLRIDADTAEMLRREFRPLIDAKANEVTKDLNGKRPVVLDPPITAEEDEDGNETGEFIIRVKMKASGVSKKTGKPYRRTVPIFDAKGKPSNAQIGGGSVLNVSFNIAAYKGQNTETKEVNGKKKKVTTTEVGGTTYLEAVQILELREGGQGASASKFGFGAVEGGYSADDEVARPAADDADDGADGEPGDYNF